MKRCSFRKETLTAYCYGELSPEETMQIEEHIAVCRRCMPVVNGLRKTLAFIKQQKLKQPPTELLDDYTHQIERKLTEEEKIKVGIVSGFADKFEDFMHSFHSVFHPRLIPVAVAVCIAVFVFVLVRHDKIEPISLVTQDILLLDELKEDADALFLENDEESLIEELENLDAIMFVQAEEELDTEDILYEFEMLENLGEETTGEYDINEDLELLDELEIDSSVG